MIRLKSTLPEVFDHNLLEKESDITVVIYCDMDGVLADFDKGLMQLSNGKNSFEFYKESNPQGMWNLIRDQSDNGIKFWATLPKIEPDADMLWKFINSLGYTVKILSSTASRQSKINSADIGKRTWLSTKLIPVPQEENIILVDSSDAKRQYAAGPNHILIDDRPKNISQWRSAGGVAIEHKNATQTISELKRILGMEPKTKESYEYSRSNV